MDSVDDQFIKKLTEITEANLTNEKFGVLELANKIAMSRATLHRKLKHTLKKTGSQFISELRLKKALGLLQQKTGTAAEIAYEVGFSSATYFNKCFHDYYGFTPGDVLKGNYPEYKNNISKNKKLRRTQQKSIIFIGIFIVTVVCSYFIISSLFAEKTIVIFPPKEISHNENNTWILEGFREGIQGKLSTIKGLTIISNIYVDKYRNSDIDPKKIAKELSANYIVTIKGQTANGVSKLWVGLSEVNTGKQIWVYSFPRDLDDDNNLEIQQEVTFSIAKALHVSTTPEEKKQIKKLPTENKTAYIAYLKGIDQLEPSKYERYPEYWKNAKQSFKTAVNLDSTFGDAWLELVNVDLTKSVWQEMYSGFFDVKIFNEKLDTAKFYLEKADSLGVTDNDELIGTKTIYLKLTGNFETAFKLIEDQWKNKKKDFNYSRAITNLYFFKCDNYNHIKNALNCLEHKPEFEIIPPYFLDRLAKNLTNLGFPTYSEEIARLRLSQDNDSIAYKTFLIHNKIDIDHISAQKEIQKLYNSDTANLHFTNLQISINFIQNDYNNAFKYLQKYTTLETLKGKDKNPSIIKGFIYFKKGMDEEAEWHFNKLLKNSFILDSIINVPHVIVPNILMELASVYALKNDIDRTLQALSRIAQRETTTLYINNQLKLPYFDNIRNNPEFINIQNKLDQTYQKEHERIKELMISKGIDPI